MRHQWLHDIAANVVIVKDCIGDAEAAAISQRPARSHRFIASSFGDVDPQVAKELSGLDDQSKDNAAARSSAAEVQCDFDGMELGNQPGIWKIDQPSMKYAYDHNFQGQEVSVWFVGKTKTGECNNLDDPSRHCWYRSRMLNDVSCNQEKGHCLHFVSHDGLNRHNFTCPTWVRDTEGRPCALPDGWQACPRRFTLQRVDGGVPQDFKGALTKMCPKGPNEELKKGVDEARQELLKGENPREAQKFEHELQKAAQAAEEEKAAEAADDEVPTSSLQVSSTPSAFEAQVEGKKQLTPPQELSKSREELAERAMDLETELEKTVADQERLGMEAKGLNEPKAVGLGKREKIKLPPPTPMNDPEIGAPPKQKVDAGLPEDDKPVAERLADRVAKGAEEEKKKIEAEQEEIAAMPPKEQEVMQEVGRPPDEDDPLEEKKAIDVAYKADAVGPKAFEAPEPSGGCLGSTGSTDGIEGKDISMIFDVHNNRWYRCSQEMLCEPFFISKIKDGESSCGDLKCGQDESCFTHMISSKRHTQECVPTEQVWVISDSDDRAKVESAAMAPPLLAFALGESELRKERYYRRRAAFL